MERQLLRVSIHAPHVRGQPGSKHLDSSQKSFQYMPPTRGDNSTYTHSNAPDSRFNTCPHAGGGATWGTVWRYRGTEFQYMPPAGGNVDVAGVPAYPVVSIHAPTRGGATPCRRRFAGVLMFQYMPPARGRQLDTIHSKQDYQRGFNTCPHAGGQPDESIRQSRKLIVSIHAPHAGGQLSRRDTIQAAPVFQYMPPTRRGNGTTHSEIYRCD